jgi:hypothetical protein
VSDPVTTAVITGCVSAVGTFVSVAGFVGRRIDRVEERLDRLGEKFDRTFDFLTAELLQRLREHHPPDAA